MAPIANIGIFLTRFFDSVGIEVINLVPVGSYAGMAKQAIVLKHLPGFVPRRGQAHNLVGAVAVAHQANLGINLLTQGESGIVRIGRDECSFPRIAALMAGCTLHAHQIPGQRRYQVPPMKGFLRAFVGRKCLVPGPNRS